MAEDSRMWDAEHNISEYDNTKQTMKLNLGHGNTCSRCNQAITSEMESNFDTHNQAFRRGHKKGLPGQLGPNGKDI